MIDAHAHPQLFKKNEYTLHDGVFAASTHVKDWEYMIDLQQENPKVRVGIGIHPWWAHLYPPQKHQQILVALEELIGQKENYFVGEIGLDKSSNHRASFEVQLTLFSAQLTIANTYNRPVVVHLVRASEQLANEIKKYPFLRVYLHGFTGHPELTKRFPNCWFGFNLRNLQMAKARKCVEIIPEDKILVESDGQVNWQSLTKTAQVISDIRGWSIKKTKKQLIKNALKWLNNT